MSNKIISVDEAFNYDDLLVICSAGILECEQHAKVLLM